MSRERELIGVVCWGWLFERKGSEKGVVIYGSWGLVMNMKGLYMQRVREGNREAGTCSAAVKCFFLFFLLNEVGAI